MERERERESTCDGELKRHTNKIYLKLETPCPYNYNFTI